MKKSLLVTLALSLVLVAAGCSKTTENTTEEVATEVEDATEAVEEDAAEAEDTAEAETAEADTAEAEAEAEANNVIAQSLTQQLIDKIKYEKWDGKLPAVSGSGATIVDVNP